MEHFNIFRRTVTILAAVLTITSLVLTSCGSAGSSDPDKRAAVGFLRPYRIELSPGEGMFYDLTPLTALHRQFLISGCWICAMAVSHRPVHSGRSIRFEGSPLKIRDWRSSLRTLFSSTISPRAFSTGPVPIPKPSF